MSWRTAATVLTVVFVIAVLQAVLAGPFVETQTTLNESGDHNESGYFEDSIMEDWIDAWFNVGLIAIFGIMGWGVAHVVRRELTRGGGGGL